MTIWKASHTDIGIKKKTNQDSFCIKEAETEHGNVILAMICDGMGGLEKGEVASATLIYAFSRWFEQQLPEIISNGEYDKIKTQWNEIIQTYNSKIMAYGESTNIQLGTTLTAILIIAGQQYYIVHVGDTRVYCFDEQNFSILTEDQTVINREIKAGRLTREQAATDPRRNVLLQCIGASKIVEPAYYQGAVMQNQTYMLCSDGFRHKLSEQELWQSFHPGVLANENVMEQNIVNMIELNKQRMETDNITALLVKINQ